MPIPAFLWTYVAWAVFTIAALMVAGTAAALKFAGLPPRQVRRDTLQMAFAMTAWVTFTVWLGGADWLAMPMARLGISAIAAVLFGFWLLNGSGRRILEAVPQSWLVGLQAYRGVGSIFLVIYGFGLLPGSFALPAGFGDWAIGLAAIPLAAFYAFSQSRTATRLVVLWNILGLADLAIAVSMGVANSPTFHFLPQHVPNTLLAAPPLVMIPMFAVPLSIVEHIASLTKLAKQHASMAAAATA